MLGWEQRSAICILNEGEYSEKTVADTLEISPNGVHYTLAREMR